MDTKQTNARQPYAKPEITVIELHPEERLLACQTGDGYKGDATCETVTAES